MKRGRKGGNEGREGLKDCHARGGEERGGEVGTLLDMLKL
jgi:hypothetical protein